jgi:hypothetical protein
MFLLDQVKVSPTRFTTSTQILYAGTCRVPTLHPPASKVPVRNASRLPHPSHPTCILRIDYSYVVGLWQLQSEQARAARRSFGETWCLVESTGAMHDLHSVPVRAPSIGRRGVETSVERTRDTPRGSQGLNRVLRSLRSPSPSTLPVRHDGPILHPYLAVLNGAVCKI